MKVVVPEKEAREKLLEVYKKNNPDVTEVEIEGMLTLDQTNKLIQDALNYQGKGSSMSVSPVGKPIISIPEGDEVTAGMMATEPQEMGPVIPQPTDPEMVALVRSLQSVVEADGGMSWNIKFLKGKNSNMIYELSKGLVVQCEYCGYMGLDNNDVDAHKNTYHKHIATAVKEREKQQMQLARKQREEKVKEELGSTKSGWGKPGG